MVAGTGETIRCCCLSRAFNSRKTWGCRGPAPSRIKPTREVSTPAATTSGRRHPSRLASTKLLFSAPVLLEAQPRNIFQTFLNRTLAHITQNGEFKDSESTGPSGQAIATQRYNLLHTVKITFVEAPQGL